MTKLPPKTFAAPSIGEEEIAEVVATLREGWVTTGPRTLAFERAFAEHAGVEFARAVSSCTAALHIRLVSMGVGPGDDVVLPSLTFAATGNVVEHVGARPVFADVDEMTWNVTPRTVEEALTPRTKVVVMVHYAGLPCPIAPIKELCESRGIQVMEDAAHAVGARHAGRPIGSHTEGVSFSFYANKNMTTGEGGMLTTSDPDLARRFETLRLHGMSKDAWKRYSAGGSWRYDILEPGYKCNMSDIQAALGLVQLRRLESFIERRNLLVDRYRRKLEGVDCVRFQSRAPDGDRHAYHLAAVRLIREKGAPPREQVINALTARSIPFSVHFIPLHTMSHYRAKHPETRLPTTEALGEELLSLPLYPDMTEEQVDLVSSGLREALRGT